MLACVRKFTYLSAAKNSNKRKHRVHDTDSLLHEFLLVFYNSRIIIH